MNKDVLKEKDIIEKKFKASQNGYNPFEVDKFLDAVTLTINALNAEIKHLMELNEDSAKKIADITKELNDVKSDFILYKNKFKHIKESDFIDNRSNIDLIKKVNLYAEKLNSLGIDVNKL